MTERTPREERENFCMIFCTNLLHILEKFCNFAVEIKCCNFVVGTRTNTMNTNESNLIIYNTVDGRASVVLYARDGSVWMNQNQLSELFDTSKPNISMHISNILKENELQLDSVVKNYLTTAADGKQYERNNN